MKLWSIALRGLGITLGDKTESTLHVVCKATCERDLMAHLYAHKFTREWWDAHIVIAIEGPREIWHMEETA